MHVLVTGSSGFIGPTLCERLLKKGLKVTGLTHTKNPKELLLSHVALDDKNFQIRKCDITCEKDVMKTIKEIQPIDCIFHLAGQTYRKQAIEPTIYFQNNFIGTLNILECCRVFNIKKIIFSSSIAVYGLAAGQFQPKYVPVDEMHEARPFDFYDLSKYYAEQLCKFYSERFGITSVVLRYSRVFGPEMKVGLIFTSITNALSNSTIKVFGDISTDFVFIEDIVNANLVSFDKSMEGFDIFNIGSGQEITLYDLCSKIIGISKSLSTIELYEEKKSRFSLDISKAKKFLSYHPTSLEQGLIECVNHIKKSKV